MLRSHAAAIHTAEKECFFSLQTVSPTVDPCHIGARIQDYNRISCEAVFCVNVFYERRSAVKILIKELAKSQWQVRLDQHAVTFRSEAEARAFTRLLEARIHAPHQLPDLHPQRAAG
jgi:hypothetical protein